MGVRILTKLCYKYTVIWFEQNYQIPTGQGKRKHFASKKEAKQFAREKKRKFFNVCVKPFIVRSITDRDMFREDVKVEIVNLHGEMNYYYANQVKKVRY